MRQELDFREQLRDCFLYHGPGVMYLIVWFL